MRSIYSVVILVVAPSLLVVAQQAPPQRDPQAMAIATQAYKALGGALPVDSRAVGNYDRVSGSSEDTGGIEILTRGSDQTSEKLTNSSGTSQTVYSRGYASQRDQGVVSRLPLEKSLASDSAAFPLVVIARAILDANSTVQFVATESVDGVSANHIRICPASPDQNFSDIVSFAAKDVWISTDSGLPVKIAYQRYDAQGSAPPMPIAVFFGNYQLVGGVRYPFQVQESVNGTPYIAISITGVAFGVGLTDEDFTLR
jgi:hypothetical protein